MSFIESSETWIGPVIEYNKLLMSFLVKLRKRTIVVFLSLIIISSLISSCSGIPTVTSGYTQLPMNNSDFQFCDLSNCYTGAFAGTPITDLKVYKVSSYDNLVATIHISNMVNTTGSLNSLGYCYEQSDCVIALHDFQKGQESLTFSITNNGFKSVRHIEFQNISSNSKIFMVTGAFSNMSCNSDFCLIWNVLGIVKFSLTTYKLSLVAFVKQKPSHYLFNNVSCIIGSTKCIVVYYNILSKGQKELSLTLVQFSDTGFGKKSNFIINTAFANNSNLNPQEVALNCGVYVCGLVALTAVNSDYKPNTAKLYLLNSNNLNSIESKATINTGSLIMSIGQGVETSVSCLISECYFIIGTRNLEDSAGTQMIFKVGPKLFGNFTQEDVPNYSLLKSGFFATNYDSFDCDSTNCIFTGLNSFSIKLTTIKNI